MTLKIAKCDNCGSKYLTSDPLTYCIQCRGKIRKKIENINVSGRSESQNGKGLYQQHKPYLDIHDKMYITSEVFQ